MTQTTAKKKPPAASKPTRYKDDPFTWSYEQIALLKAGRLSEIDVANIAWELEDVGSELRHRLESSIAVLTMHLLKWDYQIERRSRSWALTVREQRKQIERLLKRNPGLKGVLDKCLADGFSDGRDRAVVEMDMPDNSIPEKSPYTFKDLMTREIVFEAKT